MRYSIRDAATGKYVKVEWSNVMTIDNQGQEQTTEQLPALRLEEDAQTMRSKLGVFVDGIMNLRKLVEDVANLEGKVATLTEQVNVQNELLISANRERDAARTEAKEAVQAAKMAREAYSQLDTIRVNLETDLSGTQGKLDEALQNLDQTQATVVQRNEQLVELEKVKEAIREQRDTFRGQAEAEREAKLDAIRKVSELSDELVKTQTAFKVSTDDLVSTREQLEVCSRTATDWREKQRATATSLDEARLENTSLSDKVTRLEENIAALRAMNDRQRDRLEQIQAAFKQ